MVNMQAVLDFLFPPQCAICEEVGAGICERCVPAAEPLSRRLPTLTVRAAGPYAGNLRRAVLALKNGRRDVARSAAQRLLAIVDQTCILVPVPTTATRRRERGFDGCVLISQLIAKAGGITAIHGLRQTSGDRQRGRGREQRLAARGRFVWRGEPLCGMPIVLLDDVVTTGATLEDCAHAVRSAGGAVSHAIALALTP